MGILVCPERKMLFPKGKQSQGWAEGEGERGEGIFCKNKKSRMKKQTSTGCPRALGLEADALSSARPVRTLPAPGHAESTGVL